MAVSETPLSPEQVKRQVDRLRGQIRALGAINPNAVAEYEETQQRHTFLSTQSDDLHQAGKSLRAVVAELDGVMRKRFTETFRAVAEEFKRYFSLLFNGGTARLILTDPDDPADDRHRHRGPAAGQAHAEPGAALRRRARPHRHRAALSILTVNPTPFCVLDEVDAALDEANVGRFRQALAVLAERTQFIVITHNRGTMESAQRALWRLHGRGRRLPGDLAEAGGGAGARREIRVRIHRLHRFRRFGNGYGSTDSTDFADRGRGTGYGIRNTHYDNASRITHLSSRITHHESGTGRLKRRWTICRTCSWRS